MSVPMYALPQHLASRPGQINGLTFIPPQPSAGFHIRVPWGTPVRFPQGSSPRFPIIHPNVHCQVPMEYPGNGISYNRDVTNANNLGAEV